MFSMFHGLSTVVPVNDIIENGFVEFVLYGEPEL
jgi:hypothetical protein